jgi:hypothetical protein
MKFLYKYNIILVQVRWVSMMFQVILNHLVGDVARAPRAIS